MVENEIGKLLRVMAGIWPRQPMTDDTVSAYADGIRDLPSDLAAQAVMALSHTEDWLPTVAMIRRKVYALSGFGPPSVEWAIENGEDWLIEKASAGRIILEDGSHPSVSIIPPLIEKTLLAVNASTSTDWKEAFRFEYAKNVKAWKERLLEMTYEEAKSMAKEEALSE